KPFLLYTNLDVSHESTMWSLGTPSSAASKIRLSERHRIPPEVRPDPAKVHVPAYLPDDFEVRHEIARFYEALAIQDLQVGEILRALEASGKSEDTYVIYLTDHGRGLPREKRWPYAAGIHNALLIKGPEIQPGQVSKDLVSWVDLAPTILSLADVEAPSDYEGQVFLGSEPCPPRDYIFAGRDRMDCIYDRVRVARVSHHRVFSLRKSKTVDTPQCLNSPKR
ncbi:MAG: sulfatase-like hydrolase/transferase, partial [Opitutales bacterium]|nr:sulfatase-like hydrolase/transferase [Opitutales bacterium]